MNTKDRILETGLRLWGSDGPQAVGARRIGKEIGVSHCTVLYHYGSTAALREAVGRAAVARGNSPVIVQLLAVRSPLVAGMSADARAAHIMAVN